MRKFAMAGAVIGGAVALVAPGLVASATPIQINITAGALTISEPSTTATLALVAATYTGSLGDVQVTDNRGDLVANWNAKVSMTDFVNQDDHVVPAQTQYVGGLATITQGLTVTVPTTIASLSTTGQIAAVTAAAVGKNGSKWNPTLNTLATNYKVSGTYEATMTHSVFPGLT